jgi:hypothetical protein
MAAIAAATSPQPTAAGTLKDDRALIEGALIAGKLGVPNPTITALFQAGISTTDQLLMLRADLHAGDKHAFRRHRGIGPVGERDILQALERYDAEQEAKV